MSLLHSPLILQHDHRSCRRHHHPHHSKITSLPDKFHLRISKGLCYPLPTLSYPPPRAIPSTERELLEAIADSDERMLPCVRTYENDQARLSLVGAVDFEQALTAAAADGGEAAREHIESGAEAMVVETVYPGVADDSTISTRLFLPSRKVEQKASRLRISLADGMLNNSTSRNILAMTFRQVVVKQLWNIQLKMFPPGAQRNVEDLASPREVPLSFALSSSDEQVISVLAEAVCICALQNTEQHVLDNAHRESLNFLIGWFGRPRRISSKDSSVILYELFEEEIVENAKSLLETLSSAERNLGYLKRSVPLYFRWTPSLQAKLEKIGGPELCAWLSEYVPIYRLQIDAEKYQDLKLEGWRQLEGNRQEVVLTQSQMARLACILDMYFEDIYTLPNKELPCHIAVNVPIMSNKKRNLPLLQTLCVALAGIIFAIALKALGPAMLPHLSLGKKNLNEHGTTTPSEMGSYHVELSDESKEPTGDND